MGLTSDDDDVIMMMMTYVSMYVCIMAASGLKGTALPIDKTQTTFRKTRSIRKLENCSHQSHEPYRRESPETGAASEVRSAATDG